MWTGNRKEWELFLADYIGLFKEPKNTKPPNKLIKQAFLMSLAGEDHPPLALTVFLKCTGPYNKEEIRFVVEIFQPPASTKPIFRLLFRKIFTQTEKLEQKESR